MVTDSTESGYGSSSTLEAMDSLSPERRSENMRRILGKDTGPEIAVRRLVHRMGYRYRLHAKDLPGKPDLIFRSSKKVIFVHGCFWHQHQGCRHGRLPLSRRDYWETKLSRNAARDRKHAIALQQLGWQLLIIWECEISQTERLIQRLQTFLTN
jgi:DNA mismatch endonuclease (patch repair protein)